MFIENINTFATVIESGVYCLMINKRRQPRVVRNDEQNGGAPRPRRAAGIYSCIVPTSAGRHFRSKADVAATYSRLANAP